MKRPGAAPGQRTVIRSPFELSLSAASKHSPVPKLGTAAASTPRLVSAKTVCALPCARRENAGDFFVPRKLYGVVPHKLMVYRITIESKFLRAELFDRETMEETTAFLDVVTRESGIHGRSNILIYVHSSAPIFHVEYHGFIDCFKEIAKKPGHQIALLADSKDLYISHE